MMIGCFLSLYDDELLYSICTRYQIRNGYTKTSHMMDDLFGSPASKPTLYMQWGLKKLVPRLTEGCHYDLDYFINHHTMYNLFSPFMESAEDYYDKVVGGTKGHKWVQALEYRYNKGIRYCPVCQASSLLKHGEIYFSRLHNAPGVHVCTKHQVFLEELPFNLGERGILEMFVDSTFRVEVKRLNLKDFTQRWLLTIAQNIEWLMTNELNIGKEKLRKRYLNEMFNRELLNRSGRYKWEKLMQGIQRRFGLELLHIVGINDSKWFLDHSTLNRRDGSYQSDPLCHIILIIFLFGSVKELKESYKLSLVA